MKSTTPVSKSQGRPENNDESSSSSDRIAAELGISEGYVIEGNKSTYVVIKLLGEGGFGAVFKIFSMGTGLAAAKQCLEGIQDLHAIDFIHRDLKPGNFAIGLGSKQSIVYILDFGIARRMTNPHGERKTPRGYVNFKGTIRFASLACHRNQELSFKDDVESWMYLLMDLIVRHGLPWKNLETKEEVLALKEQCHKTKRHLLFPRISASNILLGILDYINKLHYIEPPYDWMK